MSVRVVIESSEDLTAYQATALDHDGTTLATTRGRDIEAAVYMLAFRLAETLTEVQSQRHSEQTRRSPTET